MDLYDRLVRELGDRSAESRAFASLLVAGDRASGAVRRGLRDDDDRVRVGCCKVLDHHLDEGALGDLIANLEHHNGEVRKWALHALACDRCKEGTCRPGEAEVLPIALRLLQAGRSRKVRQEAIAFLGPIAPRNPEVAAAIERASENDTNPTVRAVAGWYAPGGHNFIRHAAALAAN